ncbi:MAG: hypothetical protein HY507_00740 [Candidatus Zambryskibacteria bacterium]|nr:hypothetical protein [Candidatus Zambryskibacteria bacterium]
MNRFETSEGGDLESFRTKIAELEKLEEEIGQTNHLQNCNPSELEEEDRIMYDKLIRDTLTMQELREYQHKLRESDPNSRSLFSNYIANKFMIRTMKK